MRHPLAARHHLAASICASLLLAAPALAQTTATTDPAGRPQRSVTSTGVTKPPSGTRATPVKAATEAQMLKAQKAAAARDKAWDARTRASMGSICKGC